MDKYPLKDGVLWPEGESIDRDPLKYYKTSFAEEGNRLPYDYYKDSLSMSTPMKSGVLSGNSEPENMIDPLQCFDLHLLLMPIFAQLANTQRSEFCVAPFLEIHLLSKCPVDVSWLAFRAAQLSSSPGSHWAMFERDLLETQQMRLRGETAWTISGMPVVFSLVVN